MEKDRAAATMRTAATPHQQNLDDSIRNSTFNHAKLQVQNFSTKSVSPTGNHHFQESVSCYTTAIDSFETASVTKCSDATPEITLDIPCHDSPQLKLNSHGSAGYCGDCSSANSFHSLEHKEGISCRKDSINEFRESLSSRLSRGFLEFTQGSSYRLQKWKNKLQSGRRHKDSSEPPPANRSIFCFCPIGN